jgi:hypothetical protein
MGRVARERVASRYRLEQVLASYDHLYDPRHYSGELASVSSAAATYLADVPPVVAEAPPPDDDDEPYAEVRYFGGPALVVTEDLDDDPYAEVQVGAEVVS